MSKKGLPESCKKDCQIAAQGEKEDEAISKKK
jgi:hypothetical protein